jgi:hypothetical protein
MNDTSRKVFLADMNTTSKKKPVLLVAHGYVRTPVEM